MTGRSGPARSGSVGQRPTPARAGFRRFVALAPCVIALSVSGFALARALFHQFRIEQLATVPAGWPVAFSAVATLLGVLALVLELRMPTPREQAFAPMRLFFYAVCATWVGFLLWGQPYSRMRLELAAAITGGTFALLRSAEPLIARVPRHLRRAADVVAFNLCLTLVAGELGLRVLSHWKPSPIFMRIGGTPLSQIEKTRSEPGAVRYLFPCNHLGEYDEEFRARKAGEHLVITIGDSFSFGVVPHAYHFTTVCERSIGTPVYNMGVPAIGPPEYAYLLENEALFLRPEVVVINIFVGNDIVFYYEATPTLDPFFRSWLDRRNTLLWLVPERMLRITDERNARSSDGGPIGSAQGEFAIASSAPGTTLEAHFPWLADPLAETATFSLDAFRRIEVMRAMDVCRETSPLPREFFEYMLRMKRLCGTTPLAVMLIPDEYQVEDAVWQTVLDVTPKYVLERDRAQRIVLPWFEANGIPCLDLLPLLRNTPALADGRKHLYHLNDTHFNARGNRVAGVALADFLRRNWPEVCAK